MNLENEKEIESVDLIASGYEWVCLYCDKLNHEIETTKKVTCCNCGRTFEVNEYYHANG